MSEIKSRADLFEAAAKMMRMCDEAGIGYVIKRPKYGIVPAFHYIFDDDLSTYEFPIAIVEGKPVFNGDELYHKSGQKYVVQVVEVHANGKRAFKTVQAPWIDGDWVENYSWLPPKPRTVMVELLREDAEQLSVHGTCSSTRSIANVAMACRKALEEK